MNCPIELAFSRREYKQNHATHVVVVVVVLTVVVYVIFLFPSFYEIKFAFQTLEGLESI